VEPVNHDIEVEIKELLKPVLIFEVGDAHTFWGILLTFSVLRASCQFQCFQLGFNYLSLFGCRNSNL
jgi:hypothetical protein